MFFFLNTGGDCSYLFRLQASSNVKLYRCLENSTETNHSVARVGRYSSFALSLSLSLAHLFVLQCCLHRRPVLHLLGEAAVPGAGHVLLLHRRPDANGGRLLVLHHVCEACGTQPKGAESKERER